MFLGVFRDAFQQFASKVQVRHFAPAEPQGDLHLVAVFKKLEHVAHFDFVIIGVGVGPDFDLFHLDDLLLLAGLGFALLGLVFELAKVHDLTDGRRCVGRNFNQIKPRFFCHHHCPRGRDDADVFTVRPDQADFGAADIVVDAGACVALWWRVVWSAGYGTFP